MDKVRLNKFLSEMGICSRREADRLVEIGKVTVDGEPAVMGQKVSLAQRIVCDGKLVCGGPGDMGGIGAGGPVGGHGDSCGMGVQGQVSSQAPAGRRPAPVWLVVNKPRGVVCTTSDKDRAMNIVEMISYPRRVYPVGRLDKDSEGLILMTNQGGLMDEILRGSHGHEREYVVRVDRPITERFLKNMASGVELKELGQTTRPCRAWAEGKDPRRPSDPCYTLRIVLTQGLNRQIRRMCQALGYRVTELKRVRIMNIRLGTLRPGSYRRMTREEYDEMCRLLGRTDR